MHMENFQLTQQVNCVSVMYNLCKTQKTVNFVTQQFIYFYISGSVADQGPVL